MCRWPLTPFILACRAEECLLSKLPPICWTPLYYFSTTCDKSWNPPGVTWKQSFDFIRVASCDEVMWYILLYSCREEKYLLSLSLSPTHEHTSYVRTPYTLYIFYLKSLKLGTHQCLSLEFHFRNANALGPDTQWFISLFIFAHICLCPCVCLLLIPPFFQPACLPWDLGLPHLPPLPLTHTLVCMHIHKAGENIQLHSLLQCFMPPSPCYCQLRWGPIIQSVHDSAQRSLHLEHQQSARCLCWIQNTVVVHYWKP